MLIGILVSLFAGFLMAAVIYFAGDANTGEALVAGVIATALALLVVSARERRRRRAHIPRLETEDKEALAPLILAECGSKLVRLDGGRERHLSRWERWRCLRRSLRQVEEAWAIADVEVADCRPAYYQQAEWTPDVSKVSTGVMLSLKCSNMDLLHNLACRVDDQLSMKHQSRRTGGLAMIEVRFKYPRDFPWAPAKPSFGEWLEASWFQPEGEDEDVMDVGLGREIVTCRFRVVQSGPAIS